jgi:hypothetical protein
LVDIVIPTAAALKAAEGARQALKVAETVSKSLDAHRQHIEQLSRELSLRFPEDTGELSVALAIKSGFFHQKVHFSVPSVLRVTAHSFPFFKSEDHALSRTADGYVLDGAKISREIQGMLLLFEYKLEDPRFLANLVQRNQQLDPRSLSDSKTDSYWITAQLRQLSVLQSFFQKLELIGLDCNVNVAVHQDVKSNIPHAFTAAVERSARFVSTRDREMLRRLAHDQQRDRRFTNKQFDIISALQELFMPSRFQRFVNVNDPFHFFECQRGQQLFEIPFLNLPKAMTVISRTDLTLDVPAKKGMILYHKGKVREEIETIFK